MMLKIFTFALYLQNLDHKSKIFCTMHFIFVLQSFQIDFSSNLFLYYIESDQQFGIPCNLQIFPSHSNLECVPLTIVGISKNSLILVMNEKRDINV